MKILLTSALPSEISLLCSRLHAEKIPLQSVERKTVQPYHTDLALSLYRVNLDNRIIFLSAAGMGKTRFTLGFQYLLNLLIPDITILIGTCGSLDNKCAVGDTVIPASCIFGDTGIHAAQRFFRVFFDRPECFTTTSRLIDICRSLPSGNFPGRLIFEDMVTVDYMVFNTAARNILRKTVNGYAVDMESAAFTYTAHLNSIPALVIKTVSDDASDRILELPALSTLPQMRRGLKGFSKNKTGFAAAIDNLTAVTECLLPRLE